MQVHPAARARPRRRGAPRSRPRTAAAGARPRGPRRGAASSTSHRLCDGARAILTPPPRAVATSRPDAPAVVPRVRAPPPRPRRDGHRPRLRDHRQHAEPVRRGRRRVHRGPAVHRDPVLRGLPPGRPPRRRRSRAGADDRSPGPRRLRPAAALAARGPGRRVPRLHRDDAGAGPARRDRARRRGRADPHGPLARALGERARGRACCASRGRAGGRPTAASPGATTSPAGRKTRPPGDAKRP